MLAAIYALALGLDVMEPDAAQYAAMTHEMIASGDWLTFTDRGADYLDKPPLVFWTAGLAFELLGPSTVTYKLPSLLFIVLTLVSVHRLGRLHRSEAFARSAVLITGGTVALHLLVNDCRTDTLLMGAVTFATWQGAAFLTHGRTRHLAGLGLGVGLGMLAKGPLGLVVPAMALGPHAVLTGSWQRLIDARVLLVPVVVGVLLAPMFIGLHRQFGRQGIEFYLWTQSFGRITGENDWRNTAGPLFFVHTSAWALLPFTPLVVAGLVRSVRERPLGWIALAGLVMPFIALSLSRFKLPHYIYIVTPFAALVAVDGLRTLPTRIWRMLFTGLGILLAIGTLVLAVAAFPETAWTVRLGIVAALGVLAGLAWAMLRHPVALGALASCAGFLGVNAVLYPNVLRHQSGAVLVRHMEARDLDVDRLYQHRVWSRSMDFYAGHSIPGIGAFAGDDFPVWVYTDEVGLSDLRTRYTTGEPIAFTHMPPTRLTLSFLLPHRRPRTLRPRYLIPLHAN